MEEKFISRTKFDVVIGTKSDNRLLTTKEVGYSLSFEGTNYYVLKLWVWARETYYLVRNRDSDTRYTVFTKKIDGEATPRFQNPVGFAWVPENLRTHLEIRFNIPSMHVYMSLFPSTC
jgi:hypothetical protein